METLPWGSLGVRGKKILHHCNFVFVFGSEVTFIFLVVVAYCLGTIAPPETNIPLETSYKYIYIHMLEDSICSFRDGICSFCASYIQRVSSKKGLDVFFCHPSPLAVLDFCWEIEADDEKKELKTVILFDQGP